MPTKVNESMQYRENRLETFQNGSLQYKSKQRRYWTHSIPNIVQLVDCGFYFTPTKINNDQITCVCCRKKETNVEGVTNIADYHLTNNPLCPLALIISSQINYLSNNIEDFWSHQPLNFSAPLSKESIDLRKKTFGKYWKYDKNKGSTTTSARLAKAGFYYCPLRYGNDRVQCVYCNCSLDTWLPDDDPIDEHMNNSNGPCYFLEKLDQPRSRSRSNSRSLPESEDKETIAKKIDNLNINRAHKTEPKEYNDNLNILSDDSSILDDLEKPNENTVPTKKNLPNDSPKKIIKKPSSNDTKYKSLSQDETTIENEHEYFSDDYHNNNASKVDELTDDDNSRITRSRRKTFSDSEQEYQKSRIVEEEELDKGNDNDVSLYIEYSHNDEITSSNEDSKLNEAGEIEKGKIVFTDSDVINTEFLKDEDDLNENKEFPESDPTKVDQSTSEKREEIETSQERVLKEKENVTIEYIDDDDDDDDIDTNKDTHHLSSDDLSELDDNSYHETGSDSSDSSAVSIRNNKSKSDYRKKAPQKGLVNESISTRTRRGNKPDGGRKRIVEVEQSENLNSDASDTTFGSLGQGKNSRVNTSFQAENSNDIDYPIPDDKAEISGEIQQNANENENTTKEKMKKRSRKDLIDNVSFDDERFKQVLKSPKKVKKVKITDKRYSPSPPIYDLSNQNIGDYQEDNIHFLENDVRPVARNDSLNKTLLQAPMIKTEQSVNKTTSISPKVNEVNSVLQGNSNPKTSIRSKKRNETKKQNESKNANNILDMSFGDSSNNIFDNNSKSFTFDIKNPLSIKSAKKDDSEIDKKESIGSISNGQEFETNQSKSKDILENSSVHDILRSDDSVSSDIQNEVVNKTQSNETTGTSANPPNIYKEIQTSSGVSMEDAGSQVADVDMAVSSSKETDAGMDDDGSQVVDVDMAVASSKKTDAGMEDAGSQVTDVDMAVPSSKEADADIEDIDLQEADVDMGNNMLDEHSAPMKTDIMTSPVASELSLKDEHHPLEDDSVLLFETEKPKNSAFISKSNKSFTREHIMNDNMESIVAENLKESALQESRDDTTERTYNKEKDLVDKDRTDDHGLTNLAKAPDSPPPATIHEMDKNTATSVTKLLQQKSSNDILDSQSAYDEYIQDMKEINNGLRSSNVFSSPSKVSTKSEHVDNSAVASIWKEISKDNAVTYTPVKDGTRLLLTRREAHPTIGPTSNNDKLVKYGLQNNEFARHFNPRKSQSAIERFSGNFSNLLESSTPEKKKERLDSKVSSIKIPQAPLEWVPVSLSNLMDNLQNMEAASEYLNRSLKSKYDLHDDYDGELTNLISSMPEDEENMTIQAWVKHNATNCHKLAKQTCNEMIEVYKAEYLRAIKTLEQMPTSD